MRSGRLRAAAVLVAAAAGALLWVRRPATTPAMRGRAVAERTGCFACHGPGGTGGAPNPGSEEGEVPGWSGGTLMMYVRSDAELMEWVRDGAPGRLRVQAGAADPASLLRMPAFGGRLSSGDLADVVAYVAAVGEWRPPVDRGAAVGFRAAGRLGCFGCHGPAGRTGSPNPRSLTGVVPAWTSPDFPRLVENDGELKVWIQDGQIERLERNPAARFFLHRQLLRMPAYRMLLRAGELEGLIRYIRWLRGEKGAAGFSKVHV